MDKNRIRFLMATLTLIDIIIVSIFLLILSEQSTDIFKEIIVIQF